MQIILMRHGRPDIDETSPMPARAFAGWLDDYRNAPLTAETPPTSALDCAQRVRLVVCSPLRRSIESAERLGRQDGLIEPGFEEMDLPQSGLPLLRLSPRGWALLFRLAWLAGYRGNAQESARQAKRRAGKAASRLTELAETHESLLFVGHGLLNHFIARQLLANGWSGPKRPASGHWAWSRYEKARAAGQHREKP